MKKRLWALLLALLLLCSCSAGHKKSGYANNTAHYQKETPQFHKLNFFLPKEIEGHLALNARNIGDCYKLKGNLHILLIYISDPESNWTQAEKESRRADLEAQAAALTNAAEEYNTSLSISFEEAAAELDYVEKDLESMLENEGDYFYVETVLDKAGYGQPSVINERLKRESGADEATVIFLYNRPGRAYALQNEGLAGYEFAVLYDDHTAFMHELCHIFGAVDYYIPAAYEEVALEIFPESLMLNSEYGQVDSLTAFLIGWESRLSEDALEFLNKTVHIDEDTIAEESEMNSFTGFAEDYPLGEHTYTGELEDGEPHGQGTMYYNDGSTYEGNWNHSIKEGYGEYRWNNGDVYRGNWEGDTMSGYGTIIWADGTVYEGSFSNGIMHGRGKQTGYGYSVEGQWENGEYIG